MLLEQIGRVIKYVLSRPMTDYLILGLIGSFIFTVWFEGNALYFGGDMIYPLNPSWNIERLLYAWTDFNGGGPEFGMMFYPLWSFFFITAKMGISLAMAQKLYLYFNFILPGLGMYYLTSVVYPKIYPNGGRKRIACWVAALFFMFCPTLLRQAQVYWFYGVFPFVLAFFIKTIDAPELRGKIKFSLLGALFFFGFFFFLPNYQPLVDLLIILVLYSVGYLIFNRQRIKQLLKSWTVFGGLVLLINMGVLLPWLLMVFHQGGQILAGIPTSFTWGWLDEGINAMLRNLTLTFSLGQTGRGFVPGGYYFSPSMMIYFVNLFFTIAAFSALLLKLRSRIVIYFALVSLLGIIISLGPNPPFGEAYKWLVENILILRTFRTTGMSNVLIALGYAVLIGITISEIYRRLQEEICSRVKCHLTEAVEKALKYVVPGVMVVTVIALILVNGWPMVTGAYYKTPGEWPNNEMHKIPPYYYAVDSWLNEQDNSQDYRILAYPPGIGGYQGLSWEDGGYYGGYWGTSVIPYIISKPSIFDNEWGRSGIVAPIVPLTYDALRYDYTKMIKLAGLLNVGYMVVDGYSNITGIGQCGLQFVVASNYPLPESGSVLCISSEFLVNGDFETWGSVAPEGWTKEGQAFQETSIVYSGSSSARLEVYGNIHQPLSVVSKGAHLSWAYYITELNSEENLAVLQVYFADGTTIKYTVNPPPDTPTTKCVALPRVEGQWVEVDRDLGQDVYDKYGSYKNLGWDDYGLQILNDGSGLPVYFDNIKLTSTNPVVGLLPYAGSGDVEWTRDALRVSTTSSAPYYLVMKPFSLDYTRYKYLHVRVRGDVDTEFSVALKVFKPGIDDHVYEAKQTSPSNFKDYVFRIQPRIPEEVNYLSLGVWKPSSAEEQAASVDFSYIRFAENINDILRYLSDYTEIDHVATHGALDTYKIGDEYFFPRVYATSKINPIGGGLNEMSTFLDTADFSGNKPVLFVQDQLSSSDWQFVQGLNLGGGTPRVTFEQLNPTKYKVHINSAKPFFLVLSTRFNPYWIAYIDGKEVSRHLTANGYANAWYINKTGSFDVILKYKVQDYFYMTLMISGLTLVGCLYYLGEGFFKKKRIWFNIIQSFSKMKIYKKLKKRFKRARE